MPGQYAPSWLAWEEASGGRATLQGSPEDIKNQYVQLVTALAPLFPKPSENVDVVEGKVDSIGYRTYVPKNASGPLPICIWTHGGGWMTGDLDSDDLICRMVAEHTNSAVVNVDYRLTPDSVWPAQLEDSLKLYKWAHANASTIHGDPNKMYTAGGSAGGGLALQIANNITQDPELKSTIKGVAALVPTTAHWDSIPDKYKSKYNSYTENAKGTPIIDKGSMEIFYEHVKVDPNDPAVFTLLATDNHKNFPPVYFTSCEFDPLRDDAYVMEEALKEAGVPTKHDHYPGMPHYFWIFPPVPESQTFIGNLMAGIEWLKGQM
ncbi:unnamed protein product [Zymoseptoria tritici ST99CH_3D7]|uniref:Alpha/beta hydrolase fold-3 domain-containing protein n=1 Tax=Zymoseptoria tritici (strain ST99CH_3D7) TaxID=1276538 RepID=A0A1X7SAA6_ZYMT9|nr:unnamed protein product [Zymoseptoria tritici ST99CH_3D7]